MIELAIADDNHFLIQAVKEKLQLFEGIKICLLAKDGQDLVEQIEHHSHIDIILMDIEMPKLNGIEATRAVKNKYPHIKIIMLTAFDNDEHIFNAIKAGADGYLLKEIDAKGLRAGIDDTLQGGAAMTPSIALKTLRLLRNPIDFDKAETDEKTHLTAREIEVLEQLSKGLSYTSIAENIFLAPSTVRKHIEHIYAKLQVHSKLEAVQKARRNNLI